MAIPPGWECKNATGFGFHTPAPATSGELIAYDRDVLVCVTRGLG